MIMKFSVALVLLGLCLLQPTNSLPCVNQKPMKVPLPGSFTLYVVCSSRVTIFRKCSNDLLFDYNTNNCVHPMAKGDFQQIVQCPEDFNPAKPAFIVHPTDCTRYFICVEDIAHENQCPTETKFNPAINLCDLPENVNCF